MRTKYEVRDPSGELIGIFPPPLENHVEEIRALVAAHPGAEVKPRVTTEKPCADHPAYEADNCPACGMGQ